METINTSISAIILGAGRSQRMGQPKLLLPWGKSTIIEHIISVLHNSNIDNIIVVIGASRPALENVLANMNVRIVFNPYFQNGNMSTSLQVGLSNLTPDTERILVVLGDQPGIEEKVVKGLVKRCQESNSKLIVPSFQNHKGHPWLFHIDFIQEIMNFPPGNTMRYFLNAHSDQINFLEVDTPSILQDIDSPQDYEKAKPPTSIQPQ